MNYPFRKLLRLTEAWLSQGGMPRVELAGMEPTLWKEGDHDILDIVTELRTLGCKVNITTNGSTLKNFGKRLENSGINKLRISWHSLDPRLYQLMTGGNYDDLREGISICAQFPLKLSFNRIFIRGLTEDIEAHIRIIDTQRSSIKFLELYYTQENSEVYDAYHLGHDDFLKILGSIPALVDMPEEKPAHSSRMRNIWETQNGGRVEFKIAETRNIHALCENCRFKADCLEGFAEYARALPDGRLALCYLQPAHDFPVFEEDAPAFGKISEFMDSQGMSFASWIREKSLRFILTTRCNYNCSLPDGSNFCLGKRFRDG